MNLHVKAKNLLIFVVSIQTVMSDEFATENMRIIQAIPLPDNYAYIVPKIPPGSIYFFF